MHQLLEQAALSHRPVGRPRADPGVFGAGQRRPRDRSGPGQDAGADLFTAERQPFAARPDQQPDLVVGQETKQINLAGHYDILPNVTAVLEAFYTDRTSTEQLNPE